MDNSSMCSTRDKIVRSTLDLIQESGLQNVTVRKIANHANVNVASINYYFGSKDAVINEALKHVTDELMRCFDVLEEKNLAPVLRLKNFLHAYADVIYKYPDMIKNFINLLMNNCEANIPFKDFLKETGFKSIKKVIHEIHPEEDKSVSDMRTIQLISCAGYPILLGEHLHEMSKFNFNSQEQRYKYIEIVLSNIIK